MTSRFRAIVVVIIATLSLAIVLCGCWIAWPFVESAVERRLKAAPFDSAAWKTRSLDGDIRWPTRLRMADDLLRTGRLHRATRQEVERLLGAPDDTPYFKNWSMVYRLGPERGYVRIDSEWLVLRFDPPGIVAEARIVRD